ncbi:MAG: TrkA family potassium uptake protein [SAR202 cluster bacterium]|nr:TrkA family potassium uptake protein [SAR202 cluster bacterium]
MKKQVCVIGLGRFGSTLAQELYQSGHDVLAIDVDEAKVQDQLGSATYSVRADATSESILKELDVAAYDVCIVSLGSDNVQASILVSVLLKSLGVPFIIARAANELHGVTLERVGVDRVVYPEAESARRTAHVGFDTGVIDYMPIVPDFGISKIRPPEEMLGHTLEEAGLAGSTDRHGISVLAIRRGRTSFLHPAKDEEIKAGDVLIVAATNEQLGKISDLARHLEPASADTHTHRNSA